MATTPGPGNPNVNDGNPTFPAGAVINNGSGPTTVTAPNQNGGSTLPTPAQSAANSNPGPNGAPGGGATVANPTPNLANPDGTTSPFYSRINTAPDGSGTTASSTDGNGNPYAGTGESESDIEAQQLAEKQAQIDQINSTYDKQISDMTAQQNSEGQTRSRNLEALAAFSGLGGSPTAASNDARNNSTTSAAISSNASAINLARQNALSGVYSTVDANTEAIEKAQAANDTAAENTAITNAKASATAQISVLAQTVGANGAAQTWAQVKAADPDLVTQIEKQTGMSDAQLNLMYNNALPTSQQIKWDLNSVPGYAVGVDASGKVTTLNLGTAAPKGWTVVNDNGTLFAYNPSDPKGTITTLENVPKTTTPTGAATLQSATSAMASQLQPRAGKDGFVSPGDYKTAKSAWVAEGLSPKDFDAQFSYLANPNDPTGGLGAYGLSSSSSSSGGSSSASTPVPGISMENDTSTAPVA